MDKTGLENYLTVDVVGMKSEFMETKRAACQLTVI